MLKSSILAVLLIFLVGMFSYFFYPENFFSSEIFRSFLYSASLGLLNYLIAVLLFSVGIKYEDNTKFLKFVFGGMVLRIFFLLIIVFMLIKFLNIEKSSFILEFFIIYFILLIIEIVFYLKTLKREQKKNVFSGSS